MGEQIWQYLVRCSVWATKHNSILGRRIPIPPLPSFSLENLLCLFLYCCFELCSWTNNRYCNGTSYFRQTFQRTSKHHLKLLVPGIFPADVSTCGPKYLLHGSVCLRNVMGFITTGERWILMLGRESWLFICQQVRGRMGWKWEWICTFWHHGPADNSGKKLLTAVVLQLDKWSHIWEDL